MFKCSIILEEYQMNLEVEWLASCALRHFGFKFDINLAFISSGVSNSHNNLGMLSFNGILIFLKPTRVVSSSANPPKRLKTAGRIKGKTPKVVSKLRLPLSAVNV
ncbi:hypothetical protein NPIL_391861 [Nephila pilipes]|uniref:Uncharacterized protein n=1 Tax=Nephila pilipes TaxID=299642 RepID=A0A8X6Q8U9_NEPPI|nr:hypothetical protein NPIL_391861 [Nephila pilipes]